MITLRKSLVLITLILFSIATEAQIKSGTVSIGSGSTQMDLTITMNTNTSVVSYSIEGPASRWFAIGFGASSMSTSAYTIVSNVSSAISKEYNQAYHAAPILQATQNLINVVGTTAGGFKTYTFTRAMNTGDANDFIFTSATSSINIIWAYGATTTMSQHQSRGTTNIVLSNICNIPTTVLSVQNICMGDSALIFGKYEHIAGDYWDSLQTSIGCDSIVMQKLNVGQGFGQQLADTTLCQNDSIQIFGKWISQAGTYYDSLSSMYGCDSIYSITVHHIQIDTQVYISNNQLNAAYAFADHYQWYNCSNNQAINGANYTTFQPQQNGNYKVEIFSLGCDAISACHAVNWVGIESANKPNIQIGPNPTYNRLNITLPSGYPNSLIEIYSIDGQLMFVKNLNTAINVLDITNLASGMYTYRIYSKESIISLGKIIKK